MMSSPTPNLNSTKPPAREYTQQDVYVLSCLWSVVHAVDKIGVGFAVAVLGGFTTVLDSSFFMLLLGLIAFMGALRWLEIIIADSSFVAEGTKCGDLNFSHGPFCLWIILYLLQSVALVLCGALLLNRHRGSGADQRKLSKSKMCSYTCERRINESLLAVLILFGVSALIRLVIQLLDCPCNGAQRRLSPVSVSKPSDETREFSLVLNYVAVAIDGIVFLIVGGGFGMYMTAPGFWICIFIDILENIAGCIHTLWLPRLEPKPHRGPSYSRDRTIVACMVRTIGGLPLVVELMKMRGGGLKETAEESDLVASGCDGPCESRLLLLINLLGIMITAQLCLSIGGSVYYIYHKLKRKARDSLPIAFDLEKGQ